MDTKNLKQTGDKSSLWNQWHQDDGPRYPHSKVIQFCLRHYSKEKRAQSRVLDLGCGNGVNSLFMAKEGFSVIGVDFSATGVKKAQELFEQNGLPCDFQVNSIDKFEWDKKSFDLIVSIGVFDCAGFEISHEAVKKCSSMLSEGGRGIFVFASDVDFRVNIPHELSLFGYTQPEVQKLFSSYFSKVHYDRYITTYENGLSQQNDWLITVSN